MITTQFVEFIEIDGAVFSGAALFYNQDPFFSACFKEVDDDDEELRRENEIALAKGLEWAKEDFIQSLWQKSAELNAFKRTLDTPSTSDTLLTSSKGYLVEFTQDFQINDECYFVATISYNSAPLLALYHLAVPLDELEEVLAIFKTKIHCEIVAHEASLKPNTVILVKPSVSTPLKSVLASDALKSKLKRRRTTTDISKNATSLVKSMKGLLVPDAGFN